MRDDELLDLLGDALREPVPAPDPQRVEAIRTAAERRQQAASADADGSVASIAESRSRRRFGAGALAAAAVVAALVAGSIALVAARDGGVDGEVEYSGSITGSGGEGELVVTKTGIGRVIELDTDDLPILPTGELYEVWFVGPGDTPDSPNRISAGTFHPDPHGVSQVTFAAAVDPALYPRMEITAEPGDGDPSPSGVVVLAVQVG